MVDSRAHLSPAQCVERKLVPLLGGPPSPARGRSHRRNGRLASPGRHAKHAVSGFAVMARSAEVPGSRLHCLSQVGFLPVRMT